MRKPIEGLEQQRKNEILDACEHLYAQKDYSAISIKDISTVTSISRPSIYNYFQTKEEIFLGLLTREYLLWAEDLQRIPFHHEALTADELACAIAKTLSKRMTLLKISTMNLYEIEDKSSLETLKEYKIAFKNAFEGLCICMDRFFPNTSEEKKELMQYGFMPFLYGIYPYAMPTENQRKAMNEVGISFRTDITVYQIACSLLKKILS